ncbi:MAG: LicD family protein [Clostridia bacterium]|nr:LicD family protein [Clostridia bacterium]
MDFQVDSTTKKLHSCQLLLAKELKRICEKHNIKYFMIAGTLLGAVRHKGFIPWDDDMDFAIMRKDFSKFLSVCKSELGDDFILQDMFSDEHYALPVAKLLLKGTNFTERNSFKNKSQKGIFIDIFPYDNIPDSDEQRKKHNRNTYFLKRLFLAKQGYKIAEKGQTLKALVYFLLKALSLFITKKYIRNRLDTELRRFENENTKKVAALGGAYGYNKESVERKWFNETIELTFEDITLSAPKNYNDYLTYFYGDYMTPPPEDKRSNRHNMVELDFGPY